MFGSGCLGVFFRNLQAAVGSYFDVRAPNKMPSMALASDPQANECGNIEPNIR